MREKTRISVKDNFKASAPDNVFVPGYTEPGHLTPKRSENYRFDHNLAVVLAWYSQSETDGLYVCGPTQCGKTTLIREICARTNTNLYEMDGHSALEVSDLLGHYVVVDGDMIWQDGLLTLAVREGAAFLLNEADSVDPGVLLRLNKLLEGRELVIDDNGGEVIKRTEDFRFFATGNTNGLGNTTGSYAATQQQNAAFMERFWVIHMTYLPQEEEVELVKTTQQVPEQIARGIQQVAAATRDNGQYLDGMVVELPMSTHSLLRWCQIGKITGGMAPSADASSPMIRALDVAYANRLEPESREAIHNYVSRVF